MKKTFISVSIGLSILLLAFSLIAYPGQTAKHKQIYKSLSAEEKAQFDALSDFEKHHVMTQMEMQLAAEDQKDAYNVPGVGKLKEGDSVDAYMSDEKIWFKGKLVDAMVVDGERSYRVRADGWDTTETVDKIAKFKSKTGNKPNAKKHPRNTMENLERDLKASKERQKESAKICNPIRTKDQCMRNYPRCTWDNSRGCYPFN